MKRGAFGLALCLCLIAGSAVAQTVPQGASVQPLMLGTLRVVVVQYDARQSSALLAEGITRLAAELRVAGFEVQLAGERPVDDATPNEPIVSPPASPSAVPYATVNLSEQDEQLSFEIRAETSGTPSRLIILGRERDVPVLALKSVEFLRAGIAPHVSAPRPTPAPPSTARALPSIPLPRVPIRRLQLDLGGAFLTNLGVGDHLPLLAIHPGYLVLSRLALGVFLAVPLDDARFEANHGVASYRIWLGSVSASASWLKWRTVAVTVGASAGLARTLSTDVPHAPAVARQASLWSLALSLDAGVDYQLIEPLSLVAEAHLLTLTPAPVIAVVEDERRLGNPSLMLGLSARILYE